MKESSMGFHFLKKVERPQFKIILEKGGSSNATYFLFLLFSYFDFEFKQLSFWTCVR